MIKIQEPSRSWEILHMDWVTGLPPGGYRSYNFCLVIVDRLKKTLVFFPFHKDGTEMDKSLIICNRVVSWSGVFTSIIDDRNPRFTSALWSKLHQLFGAKLSFSKAYYPQIEIIAEKMIQTLGDMVRRL
ncbi:hypothetical protein O181_039410 [Austropuccinia psidii MF-1]|uniref:Integrase catalytic domain-containing protein n=1 Tax=Austropuccinia psidii MF-1 TaxID=1389203 RepID=A0A9Q3DBI5_9BASI|nr:hypothetical protein [Austropuccinia psidii MF-1]